MHCCITLRPETNVQRQRVTPSRNGWHVAGFHPLALMLAFSASCVRTISLSEAELGGRFVRDPTGVLMPATSDTAHVLAPNIQEFCAALGWLQVCQTPEYTDDQNLMADKPYEYGPHAKIAPSPTLASHDEDADFPTTRAALVAFVHVAATATLPQTYQNLRLNTGFTCVYLRQRAGVFTAFLVKSTGSCAPDADTLPASALRVLPAPLPRSFSSASDIPPVARFHEGISGGTRGVPLLGMRCGIRWCMIMPVGQSDTLPLPHQGERADLRTWAVHGWHDVQTLASANSAGGLVRGPHVGAVIAEEKLEAMNAAGFAADKFARAATVRFWDDPTGRYKDVWHFRRGNNDVWLKKTASGWQGQVRNTGKFLGIIPIYYRYEVPVTRYLHTQLIPATARFLWSKTDEDLWVACELGCCKVSGSDGTSVSGSN